MDLRLTANEQDRLEEALAYAIIARMAWERQQHYSSESCLLAAWRSIQKKFRAEDARD